MSGIRRELTADGGGSTQGRTNADLRKAHAIKTGSDPQTDNVNSPSHYTQGGVEVIDIIRQAAEGASGFEGYTLGNVIKYVMRYRHKNGAEDLRKAGVYLAWLIAEVEAQEKA